MIFIDQIPHGSVFACHGNSEISKGINLFQRIKYRKANVMFNHTGNILIEGRIVDIVEADGTFAWGLPGVVRRRFSDYFHMKPGTKFYLFTPPTSLNDWQINGLKRFLELQIGKKYNYRGLLWQAKRFLKILWPFKKKGKMLMANQANDKWYCSELTTASLQYIEGIFPDYHNMAPMDAVARLVKLGWKTYLYNENEEVFYRFIIKI